MAKNIFTNIADVASAAFDVEGPTDRRLRRRESRSRVQANRNRSLPRGGGGDSEKKTRIDAILALVKGARDSGDTSELDRLQGLIFKELGIAAPGQSQQDIISDVQGANDQVIAGGTVPSATRATARPGVLDLIGPPAPPGTPSSQTGIGRSTSAVTPGRSSTGPSSFDLGITSEGAMKENVDFLTGRGQSRDIKAMTIEQLLAERERLRNANPN